VAYADKFIRHLSNLKKPFDEVIFYDDASTDDTAQFLTKAGFDVIRGETNKGPGYARNRLAEKATCEYIHFHDIDDEFNPKFLELIDEKVAESSADIIAGQADWIDESTRNVIIKWQYKQADINPDPIEYFIAHPLGIINTVYKKEKFLKVSGFSESIKCWEDADLHVRLAAFGATFAIVDEVLAFSLRHNNGISNNQKWCWECRLKFLENYKIQLGATHQHVIGAEFEKTANSLFQYGKFSKAFSAFRHSRASGYDSPSVNNTVFKTIKKVSPVMAFFLKALLVKARQ